MEMQQESSPVGHFLSTVNKSLLLCPECSRQASSLEEDCVFSWAFSLRCSNCDTSWWVCKECSTQRKPLTQKRNAQNHMGHCRAKKNQKVSSVQAEEQGFSSVIEDSDESGELHTFFRSESKNYFEQQERDLGANYLSCLSQFGQCDQLECIDNFEARALMRLARHCIRQSHDRNAELSELFALHKKMLRRQWQAELEAEKCGKQPTMWPLSFPQNPAEMRRFILSGRDAVISNLPHPQVTALKCHGVVSLLDVVAHHLANNLDIEEIGPNPESGHIEHIGESPRAMEIRDNAIERFGNLDDVVVITLREWSDDFDSNNCKDNKNKNIWVKTVTIGAPPNQSNSIHHTYLFAIGHKGADHEEAEEKFKDDLLRLSSGPPLWFHCKKFNKTKMVHAELLVSMQDQPERRGANCIMLGNSNMASRWCHAANLTQVKNLIPSCETCLKNRMCSTVNLTEACDLCANWDTNTQSGLLDFNPPPNFPESEVPNSGKLKPTELTYDLLKDALNKTFEKIKTGEHSFLNELS